MDIVLIAGLWLPQSVWMDVCRELERRGHRPLPVALPGVDDASTTATLADQLEAALAVVDEASRPMVVGHSAACALVWMLADRRPEGIDQVVLVGGFPSADASTYADYFPMVDGLMAFPGWGPFEGADSVDLGEADREHIASVTVAVPEGVARGMVRLSNDRRFDVPVVLVCPEYSTDQARAWIDAGDVPELGRSNQVGFVDIDTGHWPMITQPAELARILDSESEGD